MLEIRDSKPGREPFPAPQAPEDAPNVLVIASDDIGYGARWMCFLSWPVAAVNPGHDGAS